MQMSGFAVEVKHTNSRNYMPKVFKPNKRLIMQIAMVEVGLLAFLFFYFTRAPSIVWPLPCSHPSTSINTFRSANVFN